MKLLGVILVVFLAAQAQTQEDESEKWKQFFQNQQQQCLTTLDEKSGKIEETLVQASNQSSEIVHEKLEEFKALILADVKSALQEVASDLTQSFNAAIDQVQNRLVKVHRKVDPCHFIKDKLGNETLTKISSGSYFYSYPNHKLNWTNANKFCEDHGLNLVVLSGKSEMERVEGAAPIGSYAKAFWVGASDIGQTPGNFLWKDGRAVHNSMWNKGQDQPDNFGEGKETCANLYPEFRENLFDSSCAYTFFFICKADEEFDQCF